MKKFWDNVYQTKSLKCLSWHTFELPISIELIQYNCPKKSAKIIDVGAGRSFLVDDLIKLGYQNISIFDISASAIEQTMKRLADRSNRINSITGDVTSFIFSKNNYDLWHDRAVFHFLTSKKERNQYIESLRGTLKPKGITIISTFGPEGPSKCSGLDVLRYNEKNLSRELGSDFKLLGSKLTNHRTPFETDQQFMYCWYQLLK